MTGHTWVWVMLLTMLLANKYLSFSSGRAIRVSSEFVTPDKYSFIQQYKFDPEIIRWDSESDLLKPLVQMASYNKFAVAASDFKGTWTSDFTGVQQLYHEISARALKSWF